jgi:hypothetical protein
VEPSPSLLCSIGRGDRDEIEENSRDSAKKRPCTMLIDLLGVSVKKRRNAGLAASSNSHSGFAPYACYSRGRKKERKKVHDLKEYSDCHIQPEALTSPENMRQE